MNRDDFFQRVRQATRQGLAHCSHTRQIAPEVGYVGAGDDPPARMAAEVEAVGGKAFLAPTLDAAADKLRELLNELQPRSVLCWQHALLERLKVGEMLAALGAEAVTHAELSALPAAEQRARALRADVGISSVTYAIAELGAVAVAAQPGQERMVSLLPGVYITVLDASQILPDLFDLFDRFGTAGGETLPSNLALINGPSKTGDIELELTTGVHGPGVWHVIISREAA